MFIDECGEWQNTGNVTYEDFCDWLEDGGDSNCEDPTMTLQECFCESIGGCDGVEGNGDDENATDPCTLSQPTSVDLTNLSQSSIYLTAKSNIQTANSNIEHVITFGKNASGNTITSSMASGDGTSSGGVNTNLEGAFGDIHNHPNDMPSSAGDLYNLVGINQSHSSYNKRIVITPTGSVYALAIINSSLATNFVNNNPKQQITGYPPDFPDAIADEYNEIYQIQKNLNGMSDLEANEMAMAFILDKYNTGISLFKQDTNGSFKRLKVTETTLSDGTKSYTSNNCQ